MAKGWLDNYGKKENANESSVSLPEGFVGMGNNIKGRNYSPAWGGQFQDGGLIPIAQDGRATRADSLAVFNNAVALNKHYNNLRKKGFYETPEKRDLSYLKNPYLTDPLENTLDLEQLKKRTLKYYRDAFKEDPTTRGDWDDFKRTYPNKTKEDYKKGLAKSLKETKSGNKNKYYYKDMYPSQIDVLAPSTLIDTRIVPQYILDYNAKNKDKSPAGGSVTGMYGYDPLAVKPFNMLTDAEKKLRIEKYGTDGVPKSYLNKSKTTTTKETTKPKPDKPEFDKKRDKLTPIQNNIQPAGLAQSSMELNSDVSGLRPQARVPKYYDVEDIVNNGRSQTNYQWYPENAEDLRQLSEESGDRRTMVPRYQDGGKTFLQPTSDKLPEGYRIPFSDPSSELAMSIGGEDGEPAYLIPSFKYGRPLADPMLEFRNTGEHLGGPFKTYQEADEWERTVRHPAVEKKENIMFPIQEFQTGGSLPGSVGFTYARTKGIPSEGPYAKKTMPSAQNGQEMRYYQNGLDWKPKGMRDGGFLDGYYKAQTGTQVLANKDKALQMLADIQKRKQGKTKPSTEFSLVKVKNDKDQAVKKVDNTSTVMPKEQKRVTPSRVRNQIQEELNFMKDWTNSPMYNQMLDNSTRGVEDEQDIKGIRKERLNDISFNISDSPNFRDASIEGASQVATGDITFYPAGYSNPKYFKGTTAHEVSHTQDVVRNPAAHISNDLFGTKFKTSYIPKSDLNMMDKYSKGTLYDDLFVNDKYKDDDSYDDTRDYYEYVTDPTETRARLNSLRYMGKDSKIYNPFKEKINLEQFNKLKSVSRRQGLGSAYDQLHDYGYSDEEIFNMLNTISQNEDRNQNPNIATAKYGRVIKDDRGQWDHPGEITEIDSPYITMQGVPYPVLGVSDTGDTQMMYPEEDYEFDGEKVTEYPMARNGRRQEQKGLVNLDNLINFTNYNKPQPGGWLSKYE